MQLIACPEADQRTRLHTFVNSVEGLVKEQHAFLVTKVFTTKAAATCAQFFGGNYARVSTVVGGRVDCR